MGPVNPHAASWHEAHARFRLRERFSSKKIAFPSCSLGDSVPAADATPNVTTSRPTAPAARSRVRARHMVPSSNWALAAPLDAGGLASSYARSGRPGYEPCLIGAGGDARLCRVAAPAQYHSVESTRYGATAYRWMRPRSHVAAQGLEAVDDGHATRLASLVPGHQLE